MKYYINFFIVALATIFSLNTFAKTSLARLDHYPLSKAEAVQMIRKVELQLRYSKEMDLMYLELADDASKTALLTRMAAASGIALIAWPLAGIAAAYGGSGITAAMYGTGAFVGAGATFVAAEVHSLVSTINLPLSKKEILRLQLTASPKGVVTYSQIQNDLERSRERIMEQYFDGSLKNQIKDSLRLGGVSKEGTYRLWMVQAAKTQALEEELMILTDISNSF